MTHYVQCDGCGDTEHFDRPGEGPKRIETHAVAIDKEAQLYHLCGLCLVELERKANPKLWERDIAKQCGLPTAEYGTCFPNGIKSE